jgi:uncharacterized membrane protein
VDTEIELQRIKSLPKVTWILILSLILRLPFIYRLPIGDENLTLKGVRIPFGEIVPYLSDPLNRDPYPPLFYWMMHLWDSIVPSPAWDRFLLVLFGLGAVFVTYRIGKSLLGEKLGLVSACLIAVFPLSIWADQWLRAYSMAAFFSALTTCMYLEAIRKFNIRSWLFFILSGLSLLYSFYLGAIVLIVLGLHFMFFAEKSRRVCFQWLLSQLAIVSAFVPWLPKMSQQFSGSTGVSEVIQKKGFWLGSLHIGALINSLLGTFGLDPFWSPAPFAKLPIWYLLTIITLFGAVAALTLLGWWKGLLFDKRIPFWIAWFSLMPAIIGFVLHQVTLLPLVQHYYSIFCWSGAIAFGLSILYLDKWHRFSFIAILTTIIVWRFIDIYSVLVIHGVK